MKSFSERNPLTIGAVGVGLTAAIVITALQYDKLPFFSSGESYSAYFTEAGGLRTGAAVQVSGFEVGNVSSVELDGTQVLIKFDVNENVQLGERTEASIKTKSLLGAKILEITPRGDGQLAETIPVDRTLPPYQLPDALGDLSATISGLDTNEVSSALATLSDTFRDTPPALRVAVEGVARFSQTLNDRDAQLRTLLANARKATGVLAERSDQVVHLVTETNALLSQLRSQSAALDQISTNLSVFSRQLSGFIADNRQGLRPALDKLNGVLTIVDNRKARLQETIKGIIDYAMGLGESVSSGPFFKAYVTNLLPGQFVQPFIDAAFSDLGLDPNVLLPSERTDPQTGQQATPALPVPYPRTGQGGEPNLTLPDAITGNPGDPRYPYRAPQQAPPPGGPPPGPPALAPPVAGSATPTPTPLPVYERAPGEPSPQGSGLVPGPNTPQAGTTPGGSGQ